jgi:hypothetical protein
VRRERREGYRRYKGRRVDKLKGGRLDIRYRKGRKKRRRRGRREKTEEEELSLIPFLTFHLIWTLR